MKGTILRNMIALAGLTIFVAVASSQNAGNSAASQSHPQQQDQQAHHCAADMQTRGDAGMGFSQAKTTHHFALTKDGGVISVEVNDPKDTESLDQIRMHLAHITKAFAAGDFDIPMFVHDQAPAGVPTMKAKKDRIHYKYEETGRGGRVVITSVDPDALAAIHAFLAFQIREHDTGDRLSIQ